MRYYSVILSGIGCAFALLAAHGVVAQRAAPPKASGPAPPSHPIQPVSAVQITTPFNKAVVRESVPVKLRDFPAGGYVSIRIDNRLITGQSVPANRTDPVFVWDTKTGYLTADAPGTLKYYADGAHAITISVYDPQNNLVGTDSVQVQLANKINMPDSQGIKLAYPWNLSTSLVYQRRTALTMTPADAASGTAGQTIQESLLRYRRTVENVNNGTYLLRDETLPFVQSGRTPPFVSYVSTSGTVQSLQSGYDIRAKYRTVDSQGHVLAAITGQNGGEQIGYSLPVLPPRRVSVGEHWQTPVSITLDWASPYPTMVTVTSTLEGFEWQDRYPTAKIRETYTGPAKFQPRPGSPLPQIDAPNIKFERIVFFAYNSGRVVRMQTTLTLTSTAPELQTLATNPSANPGAGANPFGGNPGFPGANPGMTPPGQPGAAGTGPPVNLKYAETTVIIP